MGRILDFYDLNSWKESHALVISVYKILDKFPRVEKYGVCDQLRRAASSISANIAEGFGRYHFNDKIKFYFQARGSLKEVQNFILLAKDLK
ncbi:MAG: four helix bundle protein [Candidatus Shapirobacteria bacterium]|jgi:four helix bundle protein